MGDSDTIFLKRFSLVIAVLVAITVVIIVIDHGNIALLLAQCIQHGQAVSVWQANIGQNHIGRVLCQRLMQRADAGIAGDRVAGFRQRPLEHEANGIIIIRDRSIAFPCR